MKFNTKTIHAGLTPDSATGAIMTPIYQTSTYVQSQVGVHKGFEYSRSQNPTRSALEANLAQLESGKFAACFGSGMAAIDCLLKMLAPGDEVISTLDIYGGSYRLFNTIFAKYGIKFHYTAMDNVQNVARLLNKNTKLVWIETPTNPTLRIIDIAAIAEILKGSDTILAVDNTFATPYHQRPIELGADVVMHSCTKYLGGHSDVVLGALITSDEKIAEDMFRIQNASGAICGPMDAFLVLRGIKTLHLRMQRHSENAHEIAEWLTNHPAVNKVYYPGLNEHENHDVARRQMRNGFSGMVSFTLQNNTKEAAHKVAETCKIFALAESLGGVESLIGHPATMTHASIPVEERKKAGVTDSLIRLSVGVEDIADLIRDLEVALG